MLSNPKITIKWNTTVKEFRGNEGGVLTTCVTQDVNDPTVEGEITADAAFVAIGHIPNTALFKGALEMQDSGYLTTRDKSTHCSVDGVFAAGDVADWVYRQAVTSAGSGSAVQPAASSLPLLLCHFFSAISCLPLLVCHFSSACTLPLRPPPRICDG